MIRLGRERKREEKKREKKEELRGRVLAEPYLCHADGGQVFLAGGTRRIRGKRGKGKKEKKKKKEKRRKKKGEGSDRGGALFPLLSSFLTFRGPASAGDTGRKRKKVGKEEGEKKGKWKEGHPAASSFIISSSSFPHAISEEHGGGEEGGGKGGKRREKKRK